MNLLPLLYALLAALTGLSPVAVEPRVAASAVEQRVAVVAQRLKAARPVRAFEVLRGLPLPVADAPAPPPVPAILPLVERPARLRT